MNTFLRVAVLVLSPVLTLSCARSGPLTECAPAEPGERAALLGPTLEVGVGARVPLNAAPSVVPDLHTVEYDWTLVQVPTGSFAELSDRTTVNPWFVADVEGQYRVRLQVSDACGTSAPVIQDVIATYAAIEGDPVANAGPDRSAELAEWVLLSGTSSYDPGGGALTYQWSILQRPFGAVAQLTDPQAETAMLRPDVAGLWMVRLKVENSRGQSAFDDLLLSVKAPGTNGAPVANAGADHAVEVGGLVQLDGSGSSDPDGDALTWQWSFTSRPSGSSAALSGATTQTPSFTADVEGTYRVSLVVSDGLRSSLADSVDVIAAAVGTGAPIDMLDHRVIDAEYSRALERIITVSEAPNRLNIYDPVAKTTVHVPLNVVPTSVGLSPDGLEALVGHNAWMSVVDLSSATLLKTLPVGCDVLDIVHGGNAFGYAFPRKDQWTKIFAVDLVTGTEVQSTGYSIRAGTLARLHPAGGYIYGADNGLSPSDIEKYSIVNGTPQVLYDSPYHGDYAMCGNLWFSQDGARIFTRCGNVFWSSSTQSQDMTYAGALSGVTAIQWLEHSSGAGEIAVIPADGWNTTGNDRKIRYYGDAYLTFLTEETLPRVAAGVGLHDVHGRFVFYDSTGANHHLLVQLAPSAGALLDWGVMTRQ